MSIRSHRVAQAAYQKIEKRKDQSNAKEYRSLALNLPTMILQNGLAQATGFLIAKGKAEHQALLDDLASVLQQSGEKGCDSGKELHHSSIQADVMRTMVLTRRSLDAAAWLKRYVQAMIKTEEEQP